MAEIMADKLAIVTAADTRFLPAACCQLVSVAENLPSPDVAQLFLIVNDGEPGDLKKAEEFFRQHELPVQILAPNIDKIHSHPTSKSITSAAYLRLYFDHIFDARWSRIIYFDADTRVHVSLEPLLNADLAGKPLGAVHDFFLYVDGRVHQRRQTLGLPNQAAYFNSGVIVFDWPLTLSKKKLEMARRFITDCPERCLKHDQDALNFAFADDWTPLDPRWNLYHAYFMYGGRLSPYVTHFTGPKPWSVSRLPIWREAARWYQEKLKDSPWPDFVEPQSLRNAMRARKKLFKKRRKHFKERFRLVLRNHISEYAPFLLDLMGKERKVADIPQLPRRNSEVERMVQALILEAEGRILSLNPPEAVLDD